MKKNLTNRIISLALSLAMVAAWLPSGLIQTAAAEDQSITTVADPQTLTRPETIYGDSTVNAGKVTVGKSVSTEDITVNGQKVTLDGENNFLITISQSAQVMGLASQSSVPVDVVFVLDTSGSMDDNDRAETMVTAANSAIATLMSANEQNRVGVVAFSSEGYGEGTSDNHAASVLSSLAHYTGDAATAHLQWVNSSGTVSNSGSYIAGRDTVTVTTGGFRPQTRTVNAYRHGKEGGTHIQAGIIQGAQMLTSVTNTTYTDPATGKTVTRIPFLVILSDGQPTYTYSDETWYDPDSTAQQGPGSSAYEGNGFLAALTAAYYKSQIAKHYYGANAGGGNQCYVYTMGVEIDSLTGDEKNLAQITLDPKTYSTGTYAESTAASYWNYGNTADDTDKNTGYGWKSYWNRFLAGEDFGIRVNSGNNTTTIWIGDGQEQEYYEVEEPEEPEVPEEPEEPRQNASNREWQRYYQALEQYEEDLAAYPALKAQYDADLIEYNEWLAWRDANFIVVSGQHYTVTSETITATKSGVTSIAYNDAYYNASSVSQMEDAFEQMVTTIQQKAMSVPTKVTSGDHDFDGYVTFTDPLGEYMEVKDMKGIVAGGYFYQGASFAQKLANYGTANADAEFDKLIVEVVQSRMHLTSSVVDLEDFVRKIKASENQAYYNSASDYDNSIVWWGNAYDSGEEDQQVQVMGFADNDTIEYITDENTVIPEGADYVCRSYFFYGEAGGANPNPDHEYLYFMIRVQRELVAPYRQTVVISAPASLLSMEKVLITETTGEDGSLTYTAAVEHQEPARVVYEVGLWDAINAENVATMVSADYAAETVNGAGTVNYDAATDTYHFFTNDWDRAESPDSHHRPLAKATFDAAADNEFYTYQDDTLVVDKDGNAVTADPAGTTAYYVREYFEWTSDDGADGTYTATKKAVLIEADIPADAQLIEKDGKWYIPKGVYTAATLVVNGDDTVKSSNPTGTSVVVAHPHRTGDAANSHYTVFLGNNGMLSLKADTYTPTKTVSTNLPAGATQIVDDEGNPVKVGDVLTFTVEVKNTLPTAADLTVTDYVPLGTAFVEGSAGSGTTPTGHTKDAALKPDSNNVLTWTLEDVPAGQTRYVSFQATVTEAAMSLAVVSGNLTNTAQFRIGSGANISSNTTTNPVYGKTVTDVNNQPMDGEGGLKVGDILVYHIRFHNNATDSDGNFVTADVTVTDRLSQGLTFLSADNGGTYDAGTGTVTWTFEDMAANTSAAVSLQVQVNAAAKVENSQIELDNAATIKVGNDPTITTNTTENFADVGDLVITKTVANGGDTDKSFTIQLTESTGLLSGTFVMLRGTAQETVTFTAGKATVSIKHGDVLTVKELPAGAILTVAEDVSALPGWTPAYNTQSVTVVKGAAAAVDVTNTYTLQPLTLTLKGEKVMEGAALNRNVTFGFVATPDSTNPVVGDVLTGEVTVKATGKYSFTMSPKTFTVPGVYKYTVSEIDGGLLGVDYDPSEYALAITVVDNGDGTMSATATVDGAAFDMGTDAVSFTNTYNPEDTQLELTATKALSGRQLTAGEFGFLLTDGTNSYRGINDERGNIVFETISYTAAGTYTYTMREVVPATAAQGITYDTKTYTVKVVVTDQNGQLTTAVTVEDKAVTVSGNTANTGVTFRNSFAPDDVPLVLTASKDLKSYTANGYVSVDPEAGKFRFQVVNKATGNVVSTGTNAADGTVTFNTVYFSAQMLEGASSKSFTFVISEVIPELAKDPNMLYDTASREITVTLSQKADGTLTVAVGNDTDGNVATGITFVNYQNPDSVEVRPTGTKTTSDAPEGVTFSFSVINTASGNEAAAGVGAANGSITFSALSFSEPGTYSYWIKESNAGNTTNGITYDASRYLMKVVVSRDSYNRLVANVTYWSSNVDGSENVADYTVSAAAPSFHNEYHAGGYITLTATKRLNGRTLKAGEFAFKLIRQDNGGEIDGLVAADGTVTFSTMYYSSADIPAGQTSAVIHYVMSEVVPTTAALPGVTYDKTTHDVYVRITDNGNGTITAQLVKPEGSGYAAVGGTDTGVVFTNTYAAVEGDVISYRIRKDMVGRDPREGEFEFGLYLNGQLVDIATNDANGYVTFRRTIPATAAAGTYQMVIKESKGTSAGVTYSTQSYTVYVKVTDNGTGKIEATVHLTEDGPALTETNGVVDLTDEIVFTNTYEAHDTTYTPVATKTLTGRDLIAGEFTFQTQLIRRNGTAVTNGTVYSGVNNAQGNVVFQAINYSDAGTYIYRVSEVKGSHSGVSYDTAVFYLKVVVTDDGKGHLAATASYYSDEACTASVNGAAFANTYTPADATVQLEATKTLTGRTLVDKEFSFVVRKNNVNGAIVATGSNDANGKILFSSFDITAADMAGATSKTFTYVMVESDNNTPGVTVDTTVHTVTVTVTDDGSGNLSATVNYPGGPVTFRNTYAPAAVQLPLVAFKTLTGKALGANDFTFELKDASGATVQSVKNAADGTVTFRNLKFEQAGTFVYTVTEKAGTDSRVSYDKSVYTVTVKVTDDGNGNLTATASYTKGGQIVELISFVNTYTPEAISVELEGTKRITDENGKALEFSPAGFRFEVRDADGALVTTATSDTSGKIRITGLEFATAGEYRFLISEQATDKAGYTVDPTIWCVHITIGYDAATGLLSKTGEYIHVAPESHDGPMIAADEEMVFTNIYEPADVSLTLKVKKVLEGRDLKDHDFTFQMVDTASGLIAAESRNHANGEIPFHLTFTEAKTYTYTISEVDEQKTGITYSQETYQVTVTVTDDGSGKLKATVGQITTTGTGSVDLTSSVVFHNTYKAEPADAVITARKYLSGKQLTAGQFEFSLVETDATFENALEGGISEKVTNAADGTIAFTAIPCTEVGTRYFVVSEIVPDQPAGGITYDASHYHVVLQVTDDGSGKLLCDIDAQKHDGSATAVAEIAFHNSYAVTESAELKFTVKKTMTGDKTDPSGFTFGLFQSLDGDAVMTKVSGKDGVVTFESGQITAELIRQEPYTYYIREILPVVDGQTVTELDGVTYDDTVYEVKVYVSDNGQGGVAVTYTVDGEEVDQSAWQFAFTNEYKKPPTVTPDTGDDSNLALWAGLLLASALGLVALPIAKKRLVK